MSVVLVLSSHTKSLFWFRMDLMKEMVHRGHRVFAVGELPEKDWAAAFDNHGIIYRQISVSRNGTNLLADLTTKKEIRQLLLEIRPDKVFVYQAKTISYGCQAASKLGITEIYPLVAGLGSIFRGTGAKNYVLKHIMAHLYKQAFKKSKYIFFQNSDDERSLLEMHLLSKDKVVLVHGSGVNLDVFSPVPHPSIPSFLFIGRLLRDKGVIEYLEAAKRIKEVFGDRVRCAVVGPFDTNPSALKLEEVEPYFNMGIIYYGEQTDVRPFIAASTVYVLPSYHEGTPKTVLEAMAMGRPIITTDAPGCRETVKDCMNGFLVPVKDVDALESRMKYFIEHPDLSEMMGKVSRRMAEDIFDVKKVNQTILSTMGL